MDMPGHRFTDWRICVCLQGSGRRLEDLTQSIGAVFGEVAKITGACAYDPPGTPVGEKPSRRDGAAAHYGGGRVADLYALHWRISPNCDRLNPGGC
jgi:hypothetical protein